MIKLNGTGSRYRQLYNGLRQAIIMGEYKASEKLPSSRELAKLLQISRNTVISCYEQLNAEGYINTHAGSGSYIAEGSFELKKKKSVKKKGLAKPILSDSAQQSLAHWQSYNTLRLLKTTPVINFQYGPVEINEQLSNDINRILRKQHNILNSNYPPPEGLLRLRQSIAHYAQQNRGCRCHAKNIVITNGSQQALDLIARLLLNIKDKVLIEEPAYRGASQAFGNTGAKLIRCKTDKQGLKLNNTLHQAMRDKKARLIYTTPSHQFPTGAVLSLPRRLQLLKWAKKHHCYIIEDDYDSEFRYQGTPIESIQGLDDNDQTIYIGTFSKTISPVLRIGYVILPDALYDSFIALKWCSDRHSSILNQEILADFIDSPLFARHLKRMRKLYGKRRDTLIRSLEKAFGKSVEIQGTNAGIHLLASFKTLNLADEKNFIRLALNKGVGIYSSSTLYQNPPKHVTLLMGYGNLPEADIVQGILILKTCFDEIKASH